MIELNNLKLGDDVENQDEDYVPGGDFSLPTGVYPMLIDMAYLGESKSGAMNVTVHLNEVGGKRKLRETFYVTTRKAADGTRRNTYIDKRSQKARPLPGMATMNGLAQVACSGKKLHQLTPEEKTIKLWNFEAKAEVATPVSALVEMIGEPVLVAVIRKRENKRKKVGNDYVDTNEAQNLNEVQKFLHPDGTTVAERMAGETAQPWKAKWEKQFDGEYVKDTFTAVPGNVEAASADAAVATSGEVEDLFATPATDAPDPEPAVAEDTQAVETTQAEA